MTVPAVRRANFMTPHQRKKALQSLEGFLQGWTWDQIYQNGGYNWAGFAKMMISYPDLSKAYMEARRQSGQTYEDKALTLADKLAGPNEYTGTGVRALEVAINQYRWSASRRDPTAFAEAGSKQMQIIVPVQINSSLNLAQPGAVDETKLDSPYEIWAQQPEAAPPAADSDPEVPEDPQTVETLPAAAPDPLEAIAAELGLPDEVPAGVPKRPSPGRPFKRHKSPQVEGLTKVAYSTSKKSPAVRRALGLKEEANGFAVDDGAELAKSGVWHNRNPRRKPKQPK